MHDEQALKFKEEYEAGNSIRVIANKYGTYPNYIKRTLEKEFSMTLRSKSDAQKNALKKGIRTHPTKGRTRTTEEKLNISKAVADNWTSLSNEEKQKRSDTAKEQWSEMTDGDKELLRKKASVGLQKASRDGSKLERFILTNLNLNGYLTEFHQKCLVENEEIHIDLLVRANSICIEIDGPAHFSPIWGEEILAKHKKTDNQKNGLLMSAGYHVIRLKQACKTLSLNKCYIALNLIIEQIEILKSKTEATLVEIEVV